MSMKKIIKSLRLGDSGSGYPIKSPDLDQYFLHNLSLGLSYCNLSTKLSFLASSQSVYQYLLLSLSLRSKQFVDQYLLLSLSLRSKQIVYENNLPEVSLRSKPLFLLLVTFGFSKRGVRLGNFVHVLAML